MADITFDSMVKEVLLKLESFTANGEIFAFTTSDVINTDTSIVLTGAVFDDGSAFSSGIFEIGDELINGTTFDRASGTFNNCIRGYANTEIAELYPANSVVRYAPKFPRIEVKRAILDTIAGVFPHLYAVKTYELTIRAATSTYDLPADATHVLAVRLERPGSPGEWVASQRWAFDYAAASSSTTGKTIVVQDGVAGYKIQIVYAGTPAELENNTDLFAETTGLPLWARDVIILGACWRLASFLDSARVIVTSGDQSMFNQQVAVGSATNLAKYFLGMYTARLSEAEARLRILHPIQRHRIR